MPRIAEVDDDPDAPDGDDEGGEVEAEYEEPAGYDGLPPEVARYVAVTNRVHAYADAVRALRGEAADAWKGAEPCLVAAMRAACIAIARLARDDRGLGDMPLLSDSE